MAGFTGIESTSILSGRAKWLIWPMRFTRRFETAGIWIDCDTCSVGQACRQAIETKSWKMMLELFGCRTLLAALRRHEAGARSDRRANCFDEIRVGLESVWTKQPKSLRDWLTGPGRTVYGVSGSSSGRCSLRWSTHDRGSCLKQGGLVCRLVPVQRDSAGCRPPPPPQPREPEARPFIEAIEWYPYYCQRGGRGKLSDVEWKHTKSDRWAA